MRSGCLQQPKLTQHVRYLFIALAQGTEGVQQGMQALAVAGQLFFYGLHLALERPDHRPAVPQGKADRCHHEGGKGSENPQHQLSEAVKLSVNPPELNVNPSELGVHILPKLGKGRGVGVDFCFHFGQAFDDLPVGDRWGCFDRSCPARTQQGQE